MLEIQPIITQELLKIISLSLGIFL